MDIRELLETLKGQKKNRLAHAIEGFSDKSILEYSASLWKFSEASTIEPAFLRAVETELKRLHYLDEETQKAITSLKKYPLIQTANHTVPSLKPRPLCIEWITSIGMPQDAVSLSGFISAVPFSGAYKQGKICIEEKEINVIPSPLQDTLVWNSPITEKLNAETDALPEPYKNLFKVENTDTDYTAWALRTSHSIAKNLVEKEILFFDIAEVCRLYLIEALNTDSPIAELFFNEKNRTVFQNTFPKLALFIHEYESTRRIKTESIWMDGNKLIGDHFEAALTREEVITLLQNKKICPNTFLLYVILAVNNIRPLGSFRTIEYVPWLFDKLRTLQLFEIRNETYPMLTTGMFPAPNTEWSALDYVIKNEKLPNPTWMRELIEPMTEVIANDKANIYDIAQK